MLSEISLIRGLESADFSVETSKIPENIHKEYIAQTILSKLETGDEGVFMKVTCVLQGEYFFEAHIFSRVYGFRQSPGTDILSTYMLQNIEYKNSLEIVNRVVEWARAVRTEIISFPAERILSDIYHTLGGFEEKIKEYPDVPFSREEGQELHKKIIELEKKFEQYFEDISKRNEDIDNSLSSFKTDLEFLKNTIWSLSQRKWYIALRNRAFRWLGTEEGQAVLISGTNIVKTLTDGK